MTVPWGRCLLPGTAVALAGLLSWWGGVVADNVPSSLRRLVPPEFGRVEEAKEPASGVPQRYEFVSPHMGTLWKLIFHEGSPERAQEIRAAVRERLKEIDERLTDYRQQSELNRFCDEGRADTPSGDLLAVLADSLEVARATGGAFDPTVSPLTRLWRASRKAGHLPDPAAVAEARKSVGFDSVVIENGRLRLKRPGTRLDVGGIAKGYAQDEVAKIMVDRFGVTGFLIDAGGAVLAGGPPPGRDGWVVGIQGVPGEPGSPPIFLRKGALSTAGDANQALEIDGTRYSHIVDPQTGMGLTNGLQVSVVASSGSMSDALDTAFCVMGLEKTKAFVVRHPTLAVRAVEVGPGGTPAVWTSPAWPQR